jgi:hypothetical protein
VCVLIVIVVIGFNFVYYDAFVVCSVMPWNRRRELALVTGITLELLARAKLWVTQTQESSCHAVADLRRRAGELEDDIARASGESIQLYTKATMLAKKKLGAEVKLKAYAEGRQNTAAVLAVKRMLGRSLQLTWNTWTHACIEARRIAVAEERLVSLVMLHGLASAWAGWRDFIREAGRKRRAAAFAVAKREWRTKVLLQRWRSAAGAMAWAVQILTTRAALADLKARSECCQLLEVYRAWQEFKDCMHSDGSLGSANLSKFVSY